MPDTKGPKKGAKKKKGAGTDPTSIKGRRSAPAPGLMTQVASAAPGAGAAPGTRPPEVAGNAAQARTKNQSASGRAQSQSASAGKGGKGGGGKGR